MVSSRRNLLVALSMVLGGAVVASLVLRRSGIPRESSTPGSAQGAPGRVDSTRTARRELIDPGRSGRDGQPPSLRGSLVLKVAPDCASAYSFQFALLSRDDEPARTGTLKREHRLLELPLGTYTLESSRPGWQAVTRTITLSEESPEMEVQLEMEPPAAISGSVHDARTLSAITSFYVALEERVEQSGVQGFAKHPAVLVASGAGTFCIVSEDPRADAARVGAWADGYDPVHSEWRSLDARVVQLPALLLERSADNWGRVLGRVLDEGSHPVAGAIVEVVPSAWSVRIGSGAPREVSYDVGGSASELGFRERSRATTDEQGRFSVSAEFDVEYRLIAWHEGFRPSRVVVPAILSQQNPECHLEVHLDSGSDVLGRVYLPDASLPGEAGQPRYVLLMNEEFFMQRAVHLEEDPHVASFRFAGVPHGSYELTVFGLRRAALGSNEAAQAMLRRSIAVAQPQVLVECDLGSARTGAVVEGTLEVPASVEMRRSVVHLFSREDLAKKVRSTWPDADGGFAFQGLEAGSFVVLALSTVEDGSVLAFSSGVVSTAVGNGLHEVRMGSGQTIMQGWIDAGSGRLEQRNLLRVKAVDPKNPIGHVLSAGWPLTTTKTGDFRIEGLPAGEYLVYTSDSRYVARCELTSGESVEVVLAPGPDSRDER